MSSSSSAKIADTAASTQPKTKKPKRATKTKSSAENAEADGKLTPVGLRTLRGDDVNALPRALTMAVMRCDTVDAVGTYLLLLTREGPQTTLCMHAWKAVIGLLPHLGPESYARLLPMIEAARELVPEERVKYFVVKPETATVAAAAAAMEEVETEVDSELPAQRKKRKREVTDEASTRNVPQLQNADKRAKTNDATLSSHLVFFRALADIVIEACRPQGRDPSAVFFADLAFDVIYHGNVMGKSPGDFQDLLEAPEDQDDQEDAEGDAKVEPAIVAASSLLRKQWQQQQGADEAYARLAKAMNHLGFDDPLPFGLLEFFVKESYPEEWIGSFKRRVQAACDCFLRILRKPQGITHSLATAMRKMATVMLFGCTTTYADARSEDPELADALQFAVMREASNLTVEHGMHTMRSWSLQQAAGKKEKNGAALSRLNQLFSAFEEENLHCTRNLQSEQELEEWLVKRGQPYSRETPPAPNPPDFLLPYFYAHLPLGKESETRLKALQAIWSRKYAFQMDVSSDETFNPGLLTEIQDESGETEPPEPGSFEARWPSARTAIPAMVACVVKAATLPPEEDCCLDPAACARLAKSADVFSTLWLMTAVVGQREPDGKNKTPGFVDLGPPTGYLPAGIAPAMASALYFLNLLREDKKAKEEQEGQQPDAEDGDLAPLAENDDDEPDHDRLQKYERDTKVAHALLQRWLDPSDVDRCILLANQDDTNAQLAELAEPKLNLGLPSFQDWRRWAGAFDPYSTRFGKAFRSAYVVRYGTKNPKLLGSNVRAIAKVVLPIQKEIIRFQNRSSLSSDAPETIERARLLQLFMPHIDNDDEVCHLYWWPHAFAAVHQLSLQTAYGVPSLPVAQLLLIRAHAGVRAGRPKIKDVMDNPARNAYLETLGKVVQQRSKNSEALQGLSTLLLERAAKDVKGLKRVIRRKGQTKKSKTDGVQSVKPVTQAELEAMILEREAEDERMHDVENQDAVSDEEDELVDEPPPPALAPVAEPGANQVPIAKASARPKDDNNNNDDDENFGASDDDEVAQPSGNDKISVSRRDFLGMMNIMRALVKGK
jgi:hypothetical protein